MFLALYRESFEIGLSFLPPRALISIDDFYPIASMIPIPVVRDFVSYLIDLPISALIDIDFQSGLFPNL